MIRSVEYDVGDFTIYNDGDFQYAEYSIVHNNIYWHNTNHIGLKIITDYIYEKYDICCNKIMDDFFYD